ncbi:ATP-binding protein [Pseudokineococcus sp. 5B2Z-1]|uniref:AAA family ATPase n=1 Tax=Pseudokineococcus sp. 5B2Z-1 TaxID=3132744 RepID=UPI0030A8969F
MLVQVCGLAGSGKSTLSAALADVRPVVWLRVDAIEAALRRNGLTPQQTGVAAYSVAHAIAAPHLQRGQTVVADAVSAVEAARAGWVATASAAGVPLRVIEVVCSDPHEHRRRVESRRSDLEGFEVPDWSWVRAQAEQYEPRRDDRLVVDSTRDPATCLREVLEHLASDDVPVVP